MGKPAHQPSAAAAAAPVVRRRRRWWFRPAAVLLALLVVFLIGEAVIRVLHGSPLTEREPLLMIRANRHRGWEMMPGTHYMYHHPVYVNALGVRGPELAAKRAGECRVLALGDSMVYGQGVGDDQTLPHFMQAAFDASAAIGRSFTVINGGLRGYSTNQELGLLVELGPVIEPDVVVLFWYWNDVVEHRIDEVARNLAASGPVVFDTKTKLEGWERVKWNARQLSRRSALLMWLHDLTRGRGERLIESEIAGGLRRFGGYVDQMKEMSGRHGFQLVVAIVPDPNQLRGPHQSGRVDARAAALCEAAGVPVLRLVEAAKRADGGGAGLPVVPYDGHFNAEANEAMAAEVVERLLNSHEPAKQRPKW